MAQVRFRQVDRSQLRWDMVDLDSQIPSDHRARVVWAFVVSLDLADLYASIRAQEGGPGRPPADPRILLAVWLYATLEGVGSARQVAKACVSDAAYRWLCGGVSMNYHGLSDFRVGSGDILDRLLTETVTGLVAEGLVTMDEVAIDGTKVKASAGRGKFRRAATLERIEGAARERVVALKAEVDNDPEASSRRRQAARLRAAEDVARRAEAARRVVEKLRAEKVERAKRHKKAEAKKAEERASLTDPEARAMRFADGATRLGYNVQLAAATETGVIIAVDVTDRRNDAGLAGPMVDQIKRRFATAPKRVLVDTTYATRADIVTLAGRETEVYSPVPADRPDAKPATLQRRAKRRRAEPEAIKAWRQRMAQPDAADIYGRRKRIETINGILKGRNFGLLRVRSIAKVKCVALLQAIAHNLWRAHCLRAATP
ncbi:MAG: IS1182 family transposase [Alphaproteobacteria bacterium]|nr:IS1182 family transposase [Alphaproteobacteria bacterium]